MSKGGALDSRLRGNDRECREISLPWVWGCPPDSLLPPKNGGRGLNIASERVPHDPHGTHGLDEARDCRVLETRRRAS